MDMGKGKASKQLQACKYENAEGNRGGSLVFRPLLGYMVVWVLHMLKCVGNSPFAYKSSESWKNYIWKAFVDL